MSTAQPPDVEMGGAAAEPTSPSPAPPPASTAAATSAAAPADGGGAAAAAAETTKTRFVQSNITLSPLSQIKDTYMNGNSTYCRTTRQRWVGIVLFLSPSRAATPAVLPKVRVKKQKG